MTRLLLLGGLDPSGGAGVTVDATVAAMHGVGPLPVVVTTTIQGLRGFRSAAPVPADVWRAQVEAVLADGPVAAVKVGYVGDAALAADLSEVLSPLASEAAIVVDPVLSATAGGMEPGGALVAAYLEHLMPLAALVTPNTPELEALAGGDPAALLAAGAAAVLHKGGHGAGREAVDELWSGGSKTRWPRPRLDCGPVRGTGCALASAVASHVARGAALSDACGRAGDWLASLLEGLAPRSDGLPRTLPLSRGGTATR